MSESRLPPLPRVAISPRLRPWTFLLVVCVASLAAAGWEVLHSQPVDLYLDPDANYTDVVARLYPDNPGVMQLRASQLNLCMQARTEGRPLPPSCDRYEGKNSLEEMRRYLERGKAGSKHMEDLYYNEVKVLQLLGASRTEIEEAWEDWKREFPLSERPDPRGGGEER